MSDKTAEVQACPFCGSAEGLDFGDGSTFRWLYSDCTNCGASIGEVRIQTSGEGTPKQWRKDAEQKAIAAWNTRACLPVAAPAVPEWIPVSDRLPPKDTLVLVYTTSTILAIAMDEWCDWFECPVSFSTASICVGEGWGDHEFEEVTHWMPLPAVPQAGALEGGNHG